MELVMTDGADTLAAYHHNAWGNYSAVTAHSYHSGKAYYIGCYFEEETAIDELTAYIASNAGIKARHRFPIIVKRGFNDDRKEIIYYLNYSADTQTVTHEGNDAVLLLPEEKKISSGETFLLPPWGVEIAEMCNTH